MPLELYFKKESIRTLKKSLKPTRLATGPYTSSSCLKKNQATMPTSNRSMSVLCLFTNSSLALLLSRPLKNTRGSLRDHGMLRGSWMVNMDRDTLEVQKINNYVT